MAWALPLSIVVHTWPGFVATSGGGGSYAPVFTGAYASYVRSQSPYFCAAPSRLSLFLRSEVLIVF
jgi:hypothetical protein